MRCSNKDTLIQIRFLGFCLQLGLGTPGRLWDCALQGDSRIGHSRETLGLGTPGRLWGWALQGDSGGGHSRETLGLGTPGRFWGCALQESLGWELQGVGAPGIFWGWTLQGVSKSRPGEEKSSGRGEELSLTSNNPIPKVGKKFQ